MVKTTVKKHNVNVKSNLKLAVILGYVLIALNVVSGILLLPFITGSLGQSGYGVYTAASTLVSMFLVDLGLGSAATRFVSKYRVTKTQDDINALLSVIWKCFFLITAVISIVFVAFYFSLQFIYRSFTEIELGQFRIVYIMVASSSAFCFPFNVITGILVAYDKAYLNKIADITSKVAFIIATIVCIALKLGLYWMTACFILHSILSVVLKLIFAHGSVPLSPFAKVDKNTFKSTLKSILAYSIWTSISTYSRTLMLSFMTTILGITSPESEGTVQISIYSIAYQIETYVSYFSTTFGTIFYPEVSRRIYRNGAINEDNVNDFNRFNNKVAHIQTLILVIVCIGLPTCGNEFLQLWLNGDLANSHNAIYTCILAICSTAVFLYPLQILETGLNTSGHIKYQCLANVVGSVAGISLAFPLSYFFGAFGCCVSIAIGTILRIAILCFFGYRYLNFKVGAYFKKTYLGFILPTIVTVLVGLTLNYLMPTPSWLTFLVKVACISGCYALTILLFGLNAYEKRKFCDYLARTERFFSKAIHKLVN